MGRVLVAVGGTGGGEGLKMAGCAPWTPPPPCLSVHLYCLAQHGSLYSTLGLGWEHTVQTTKINKFLIFIVFLKLLLSLYSRLEKL